MIARCLLDCRNQLGEGPFWDHRNQCLYWVDIEGKRLFRYDWTTKTEQSWSLPTRVGTVVPGQGSEVLLALSDGVYRFDLKTETLTFWVDPEPGQPHNRFNDGKCDPQGRFWVGSMNLDEKSATAALHSISPNGKVQTHLKDVRISNGLVWSADQRTFYYIDTPTQQVRAYDFDASTGQISGERVVIEVPGTMGYPDGMTIDANGMLWIAHWNGHAVTRWNPQTGIFLKRIDVPAHNVTSCVFGGPNLDKLFISSASLKTDLAFYPRAGGLFVVEPGVRGLEGHYFGS